jgi:two-component system CheB/CheR fusion protein
LEDARRLRESVAGLKVLVVEDNADLAAVLCRLLRKAGLSVELAANGHAALAVYEVFRPDVVLCDVALPDIDGREVVRLIRELDGPQPLLIAHSGYASEPDIAASLQAGFDEHVAKPVSADDLLRIVAEFHARKA